MAGVHVYIAGVHVYIAGVLRVYECIWDVFVKSESWKLVFHIFGAFFKGTSFHSYNKMALNCLK